MNHVLLAAVLMANPAQAQTLTSPASPPAPSTSPALPGPDTPPPAPPPEPWLSRPNVDLTGLDKITTRLTALSGKIGQPIRFGTLTIVVRNCVVHRPDLPSNQAAYLDITDSANPQLAFHGWMFLSAPSVSMLEHPIYDIRLTACRA